ncbi:MAG: PTS sugar transporter subunit IIC [Peptostreptococcaceae bacterium]
MEKFMEFMDKYIIPVAGKIGSQRHLVAIRDAFVAMIPIIMIGSLAVLLNNLPFQPYQDLMANVFGPSWTTLNGNLWWGSLALMGLFLLVGISYFLAKSYDENEIQATLIAISSFFILIPQVASITQDDLTLQGWGLIPVSFFGTTALFTAILVAIVSTELYVKLSSVKQLLIKLPDGVPPAVSRSFSKLIPGMLTLVILGIIGLIITKVSNGDNLTNLINTYLGMPLKGVADTLFGALLISFMAHALWTVGLHGTNIMLPFTSAILLDLGAQNAELFSNGATEGYAVMAGPFFDAFVFLGGAGATLGLLVALMIAGKRRKDMVGLGFVPGLFNINEPVMFGMPIVLNPIYMIPFVLIPLLTTTISYLAIQTGIVHPVITATIPWVTPPVMGGLIATGHWTGGALAFVNLVISIVAYIPFVIASEKMEMKKLEENK